MLIWLSGSVGSVGYEDGVLRARDVQTVLDAQDAQAQMISRAEETLAVAQQEAEAIVAAAQEQASMLLQEAQQSIEDATRQGYEDGQRQAIMEWHDKQASHVVDTSQSLRAMHEKLADIVTTAVERIVHTESRTALYQRALKNVQTLTRGATSLTLRVSPADYDHARNSIGELGDARMTSLPVDVLADAALRPGSCIFESDLGVLDASLETQLDSLRMAMGRAVRNAVIAGDAQAAEPQQVDYNESPGPYEVPEQ